MSVIGECVSERTWNKLLDFSSACDEATPYLLMDADVVREKVSLIGRNVRNARVFYAIKANADMQLLTMLDSLGIGFEIASEGELRLLASLGVEPGRIITSNTVKTRRFLEEALSYGMRYFAYDSVSEVDKLSRYAPGSFVYVRLTVPNEGSEWPLSKKFGVETEEARELLVYAQERGLVPVGITFHVGSQCTNICNWNAAIDKAKDLWDAAADSGVRLRMLNIGGGYPIRYTKDVVDIETIERRVSEILHRRFPEDIEIFIEPGRAMVGDAGIFVATVIGKAVRSGENWLYLDVGVFNGLMESVGGIRYSYVAGDGEFKKWTLAGPSCDSFDVIDRDVALAEPEVGDRFLILSSGAYTTSYASAFNGFALPKTILV